MTTTPPTYKTTSNPTTVQQDLPVLRVDDEDRTASTPSLLLHPNLQAGTSGQLLDNDYSTLGTWLAGGAVGSLVLLALSTLVFGVWFLMEVSQLFGYIFVFVFTFLVSSGSYLWWFTWMREPVGMNSKKVIRSYAVCCVSELIATLGNMVIDLGPIEHLPIDLSFYSVLVVSLLALFSGFIHEKGMAGMLTKEVASFVALTTTLHISTFCLFESFLPELLYSQIPFISCLFTFSLGLLLVKYHPNLSLATLRRVMRTSIQHGHNQVLPQGFNRRVSTMSLMSNMSSLYPRTSQSSLSGFQSSMGGSVPDVETLQEANGMIGDILLREVAMSQKNRELLQQIQKMLSAKVTKTVPYSPRPRYNSSDTETDASASSSKPTYRHSMVHRRSVHHNKGTFTTTTTATGLPTVENDPIERKRSVALRDVKTRMSQGRPSVHRLQYDRQRSDSPLTRQSNSGGSSPYSRHYKNSVPAFAYRSTDPSDVDRSDVSNEVSGDEARKHPQAMLSLPATTERILNLMPPPQKAPPPAGIRRLGIVSSAAGRSPSLGSITDGNATITEEHDGIADISEVETEQEVAMKQGHSYQRHILFSKLSLPNKEFDMGLYQNHGLDVLGHVSDWDFPIFELEEGAGDNVLSQMAYCLFHEAGLMETFKIPLRSFLNYFRMLERNYGRNTYHTKTHAADVLHATSYLLFEQIPEFSYEMSRIEEREWKGHLRKSDNTGSISSAFSILEVFVLYMASAMHDFDHPGRTNAFLVATNHELATLYNDHSVLENHHASASWQLLTTVPDHNFLNDLDSSELKRFRFLLIECILATDLKHHFKIVREFKEKCDPEVGGGIDWSEDVDRLMIMKMIIKMADINTPTKSYELHRNWTVRITEEFYQQHDDEIELNLPRTIFMNRNEKEKLPAIQVSFIENLVSPLFHACAEAGIIPGILDTDDSEKRKMLGSQVSVDSREDDEIPDDAASLEPKKPKVISIILMNLKMNFDSWKAELPAEEPSVEEDDDEDLDDLDDIEENEVYDELTDLTHLMNEHTKGRDREDSGVVINDD